MAIYEPPHRNKTVGDKQNTTEDMEKQKGRVPIEYRREKQHWGHRKG